MKYQLIRDLFDEFSVFSYDICTYQYALAIGNAQHPPEWPYGNARFSVPNRFDRRTIRAKFAHTWPFSISAGIICHRKTAMDWSLAKVMAHHRHRLPTKRFPHLAWTMWPDRRHANAHQEAFDEQKFEWLVSNVRWVDHIFYTHNQFLCVVNVEHVWRKGGGQESIQLRTAQNVAIRTGDDVPASDEI